MIIASSDTLISKRIGYNMEWSGLLQNIDQDESIEDIRITRGNLYKCGKICHTADKCKMKKKINEIFNHDEDLKDKLINLLIEDDIENP